MKKVNSLLKLVVLVMCSSLFFNPIIGIAVNEGGQISTKGTIKFEQTTSSEPKTSETTNEKTNEKTVNSVNKTNKKGILPQTGELITFIVSIIGLFVLLILFLINKKKKEEKVG